MAKAKAQRKPKARAQLELAEVEIERAAQHVEDAIIETVNKATPEEDDEFMTEKEMERQEEQAEFEAAIDGAELDGEEPEEKHSIVKPKFKDKYIQNARALGI